MKKYLIAFFIAAALIAATVWWWRDETTLAELQKQYLLAETDAEKAKVVERVEKFYLKLSIPDSIRRRLDQEVARQIDTAKITLEEAAPDTNVYRLESRLQDLLRQAAIARVRDENETFQTLIRQAKNLAKIVDAGMENNYWVPFVEKVNVFARDDALAWLKARRAEELYRENSKKGKLQEGEFYASLGLKFIQQIDDQRLYLDIIQRLQRVLCDYHSMHELSIALTQKPLLLSEKIKYHLRANGLLYYQAEALFRMEENQAALKLFDAVSYNAEKLVEINDRQWFIKYSLLRKGDIYRKLGEFEKAWHVCREAERLISDENDDVNLKLLKSTLFFATGRYDETEEELKNAIAPAERLKDKQNIIICYNNLGALYARLTDYDLALAYYRRAQALLSNPNPGTRMMILGNIAEIMAAKNDSVQFESIIAEARRLLRSTYSAYMEALLFSNIGNWYHLAKKYREAMAYHQQADSIAYRNGFLRLALEKRMDHVDCLIALSRFGEARALLAEIEPLARQLNDTQGFINVLARVAQLNYLENNFNQAVASSERFLREIETICVRFNNPALLIAYRQKIYDVLKSAVLYEIARQDHEAAFVKLDEAKSYALKSRLLNRQTVVDGEVTNGKPHHSDFVRSRLRAGQLVLDYMITPDTLYVFALDQSGLRLRRKKIDSRALQQTTRAYRDSINQTLRLFQHDNANRAKAHYTGTVALAEKLYRDLLEWPEISARLPQTDLLYIIPDEFLYEVPFSTLIANCSEAQTFLVNHTAVLASPSASLLPVDNFPGVDRKPRKDLKVLISADKRFPSAEKFVAKIKELFPLAEELTVQDSASTKDQVLAQLQKGYQVYIFAGHGQANSQYPEQGYIELAVRNPKAVATKIVRLTMADLKTINWLGAEMVILVGCETAGGKLYRGAGISGLQQEFLALGAKNVLGNLWEVDATFAIPQAQDFLATWAATWDSPHALQASQRQTMQTLRESRYYQHPHPYFWGSAVLLTAVSH